MHFRNTVLELEHMLAHSSFVAAGASADTVLADEASAVADHIDEHRDHSMVLEQARSREQEPEPEPEQEPVRSKVLAHNRQACNHRPTGRTGRRLLLYSRTRA